MKVLSKRQILMLHSMLIAQSGGMDGLRDEGLLESALESAFLWQTVRWDMKSFWIGSLRISYNLPTGC